MKELIKRLNEASYYYYNTGQTIMSDAEFDNLLEKLKKMEEQSGVVMSNSPTINVGAPPIVDKINEVEHVYPMLSLNKIHKVKEVVEFIGSHEAIAMLKMDGLSCRATYTDGILTGLCTRGNGIIGKNVLHLSAAFENLPSKIDKNGTYIIDGEAIIKYNDFLEINDKIKNEEDKYKNPRNLASGTLALHDCSEAMERHLRFIAWDVIDGTSELNVSDRLLEAINLGFTTVPCQMFSKEFFDSNDDTRDIIYSLRDYAEQNYLPIDGVVVKLNNVEYGRTLGRTEKFFRNAVAFKFEDEVHETKLINIEYTMGKTGILCPTAIFEPVEIDGTEVSRASVHNISILTQLDLHVGDIIEVYKANQIIPQVKRNISAEKRLESDYIVIPPTCPVCGGITEIKQDNDSKVLWCTNPNCKGKLLGKLTHAVSKNALNIDGLSEASIEKFINYGWLNSIKDIYHLSEYKDKIIKLEGFGLKSVNKLLDNIEKSRNTNLQRLLYSLSIPLLGSVASKDISKYCHGDVDEFVFITSNTILEFASINGIGAALVESLDSWWDENSEMFFELLEELHVKVPEEKTERSSNIDLSGKSFVITGSLNHFANRDELKALLESLGAKVSGSVSTKTFALVCNQKSNSSKYKKSQDLGINIWTEDELLKYIEG